MLHLEPLREKKIDVLGARTADPFTTFFYIFLRELLIE